MPVDSHWRKWKLAAWLFCSLIFWFHCPNRQLVETFGVLIVDNTQRCFPPGFRSNSNQLNYKMVFEPIKFEPPGFAFPDLCFWGWFFVVSQDNVRQAFVEPSPSPPRMWLTRIFLRSSITCNAALHQELTCIMAYSIFFGSRCPCSASLQTEVFWGINTSARLYMCSNYTSHLFHRKRTLQNWWQWTESDSTRREEGPPEAKTILNTETETDQKSEKTWTVQAPHNPTLGQAIVGRLTVHTKIIFPSSWLLVAWDMILLLFAGSCLDPNWPNVEGKTREERNRGRRTNTSELEFGRQKRDQGPHPSEAQFSYGAPHIGSKAQKV